MGDYRERVGSLTVGGVVYPLRLAPGRTMPYQPTFALVWPSSQEIAGQTNRQGGDPNIKYWHTDRWDGGEGEDLWKPELYAYHGSTNVRPQTVGDSLILGANQALTTDAVPATFVNGVQFGFGIGQLWAGTVATVHAWNPATSQWSTAGWTTGAGAGTVTSIADWDDGTNLAVAQTDKHIYKVASGANSVQYEHAPADPFTYHPLVRAFNGSLYALDGNKLYSISKTVVNTRTLLADVGGSSANYFGTPVLRTFERFAVSDKGPIWFQRLDNGITLIWEYNEASDTDSRVGMLPVQFAFPYSIGWAHGFIFVGFRFAAGDTLAGDAYLYYSRGSQNGIIGPIRSDSGVTASEPVRIAGCIGDELIIYYAGAVWAYSLSSGGLYQVADSLTTSPTTVRSAVTFGKDIFLANVDDAAKVERVQTDIYTTRTASLMTGRYDFDYAGIDKCLLDVTVTTLPLPLLTSITLQVSVEGGTFAAVTGTFTGDGAATSYTWTVSTPASSIVGRDFELKLLPLSTSSAATPTIRSITARAIGVERQRIWRLELDTGTWRSGSAGGAPRSADVLADLRAIGESNGLASFTNPWEGEEHDAATEYTVLATQLLYDEVEGQTGIGVLELRECSYV